jgi:hypothetical protein
MENRVSRTYRQPPYWANAQLLDLLKDLPLMHPKSQIKKLSGALRRCRGQDGSCVSYINHPSRRNPKGYGYSGIVSVTGKRFSKRKTARIMRRRGSKEVKAQLHELWNEDGWDPIQEQIADSDWYDDEPMEKPDWEHEWYWAESRHDDFHDDDLSDHDMPNFDYLSSYEPNHYAEDMQRLRGLIVTYGTLGLREMLEIAEIQTGYKL